MCSERDKNSVQNMIRLFDRVCIYKVYYRKDVVSPQQWVQRASCFQNIKTRHLLKTKWMLNRDDAEHEELYWNSQKKAYDFL